jgi:hypothetical protein
VTTVSPFAAQGDEVTPRPATLTVSVVQYLDEQTLSFDQRRPTLCACDNRAGHTIKRCVGFVYHSVTVAQVPAPSSCSSVMA